MAGRIGSPFWIEEMRNGAGFSKTYRASKTSISRAKMKKIEGTGMASMRIQGGSGMVPITSSEMMMTQETRTFQWVKSNCMDRVSGNCRRRGMEESRMLRKGCHIVAACVGNATAGFLPP